MSTVTIAPTHASAPPTRNAVLLTRARIVPVALFVLALVLTAVSLSVGATRIAPGEVFGAITGTRHNSTTQVVLQFQLPRVLLCWLVGIALATSGGVLQGVIRNPLAAPNIIGVTQGAGLAGILVLLVAPGTPVALIPVVALLGGFLAAGLVYVFAYRQGTTPARLALVGIAVGAVCEAGIRFVLVRHPLDVNAALIWLTGSLYGRTMTAVYEILPWVLVLVPAVLLCARRLDVLGLGDDLASGLGESVERTRRITLLLAVALASATIAVAGTIGFIGLIAPHIARRLVGGRHIAALPCAALIGVVIMLCADTVGRGIDPPLEVPAGLITAVIGAPYFLYLLAKTGK